VLCKFFIVIGNYFLDQINSRTVVTSPLARVVNCVYQDMRVIQQIESPVDTLEEVVPYPVIVSEGDRFQMNATMECASARPTWKEITATAADQELLD
jgi:hypothetical protein